MPSSRSPWLFAAALMAASGGWLSGSAQRGQTPPSPLPGTAFIAGQVTESPSGRPVPGATISVVGGQMGRAGSPYRPVLADSQGRFFFAELPASTYTLQVNKSGYAIPGAASQARLTVAVADAERITDLRVRLVKLATLSGVVRDEVGDAVVGTGVMVFRRAIVNGQASMRQTGQARTDDRGSYHFAELTPGDYLVCACSRDAIPFDGTLLTTLASEPMALMGVAARALKVGGDVAALDSTLRTYAPTFYPGSSSVARATRVTLAPGEDRSSVDISVVATRATRVSGTVIGATSPVIAQSIRLVPASESDEGAALAQLQPVLVQADGRFDFAGVPPGQYVLRVNHVAFAGRGGPTGSALAFVGARGNDIGSFGAQVDEPPMWAAEPVSVGDDGVRGLAIALRRGARIAGQLEFSGAAPPPAAQVLARAVLLLQPLNPDPVRGAPSGIGRVTADGTFEIRGVTPGRYVINVIAGVPGWPTLKSVVIAGVDVIDKPIDVEAADIAGLVLTYGDTPQATLAGTFAGNARDDVTVVAFPADRGYWTNPGAATRRFRTAPIVSSGSFTMPGIPAGEYFVVAVPDDAVVDWQEASRLEAFSRTAQRITLADGDKKSLSVKR